MAQITSDFLPDLTAITDDSVQQIRKTAESPPRVSVYDVFGLIYGFTSNNSSNVLQRLVDFPRLHGSVATSDSLAGVSETLQ